MKCTCIRIIINIRCDFSAEIDQETDSLETKNWIETHEQRVFDPSGSVKTNKAASTAKEPKPNTHVTRCKVASWKLRITLTADACDVARVEVTSLNCPLLSASRYG